MKSEFLKRIIVGAVISTSMSTFVSTNAFAVESSDFYAWQNMNNEQSNGYWKLNNGKWYYFNYSEVMQIGWIYDKGQWYYADSKGIMQTGVIQVDGKIYLLSESGAMQIGNAVVNGKYYTFGENGAVVGNNVPVPTRAYTLSGVSTVPYTSNQIIKDGDSSPSAPNTEARDPNNLIKYSVKFKDDDGDELRASTIEKDDRLTLYSPTKKGYKFVEWNSKKNGDGKSYDAGDTLTITDNISLYAQWEEVEDSDNNSGDNVLVEDITITSSTGLSTITTKAGTLQMKVKVLPVDVTNSNVTWSVESKTGKATISESGLLTASANGTIAVVATAKDGSKVVGKSNVIISGQGDSGTTTPGGGTTTPGGGTTTPGTTPVTGGTITAFDPNVKLDDVVINAAGNIVDLSLLKASGKLPTKAKVTCSLNGGKVQEIEMEIKGWIGTFDGTVQKIDGYILTATLGDLPSGYTKPDTLSIPSAKLKVIVQTPQIDGRNEITGAVQISEITLDSDKHIMNTTLLNASGILPKTVILNYAGGTIIANVKTWNCTNADDSVFNGSTGIKKLEAVIENPIGYKLPSGFKFETTLKVNIQQKANIKEIVEVVKNADLTNKLLLDYASGDTLDLGNLTINVKYNDGSDGRISYAEFADNNITTPSYFHGMPLSTTNTTTVGIPVMFNNKKVYTEPLKVVQALNPIITADGTATYSITTPSAVTFSYTLGTGTKKAKAIELVTLGGIELTPNTDYIIDEDNNKLIINQSKLEAFINGKTTPSTYVLKVTFTPEQGTIKSISNANIGFIKIPDAPSGISLAIDTAVPAKDNTIKLLGLKPNVAYEYCVGTTENWSNKFFTSTVETKELTDTSLLAGKNLYIRIKSLSDGKGAINPPSDTLTVGIISENNIGKTKSSEKLIKSFNINYGSVSYAGIITEGTSSGTIKVLVPTVGHAAIPEEILVSNLVADVTISEKASISGATTDFTSPVKYTVTAEDGTTRIYTVTVVKTELQTIAIRPDTLQRTVLEDVEVTKEDGSTVIEKQPKTETFNFFNEYNKAGIAISASNGLVQITLPANDPLTTGTDSQSSALDSIKEWTPYMKEKDPQSAYVGMKFTNPYSTAVSVKIAGSLEELKSGINVTTVKLSDSLANTLGGQYLEQIPVAKYGTVFAGVWSKFTSSNTKYYAWIDSKGTVLGYTSLTIKVV